MDWLVEHWGEIVGVVGAVVLASRALLMVGQLIAKLTPTTKDDKAVAAASVWIDRAVSFLKLTGMHIADKKENKG